MELHLIGHLTFALLFLQISTSIGIPMIDKSNDFCHNKTDGKFSDQSNCHRTVHCINGYYMIKDCSNGEVVNRKTLECEKIAKFPCNATRTNQDLVKTNCSEEGVTIPSPKYCDKFLVCLRGTYHQAFCPPGQKFDNLVNKCATIDNCLSESEHRLQIEKGLVKRNESPYLGICSGRPGKNISDPLHCKLFVNCELNPSKNRAEGIIMLCENKRFFSTVTNTCESPQVVICGERFRNTTIYGKDPNFHDVAQHWLETRNISVAVPRTTASDDLGRTIVESQWEAAPGDIVAKEEARRGGHRLTWETNFGSHGGEVDKVGIYVPSHFDSNFNGSHVVLQHRGNDSLEHTPLSISFADTTKPVNKTNERKIIKKHPVYSRVQTHILNVTTPTVSPVAVNTTEDFDDYYYDSEVEKDWPSMTSIPMANLDYIIRGGEEPNYGEEENENSMEVDITTTQSTIPKKDKTTT